MNKNEILKIHKQVDFLFEKTCEACPEQYDVYLASDTSLSIAYVRVRFGQLTVQCPDAGGKIVYQRIIGNEFKGTVDIHDYVYDIVDSIQAYYMLYAVSKIKADNTTKVLSSKYEVKSSPDAVAPIVIGSIMPAVVELSDIVNEFDAGSTGDVKKRKGKKGKENKKDLQRGEENKKGRGVKLDSKKDPSRDVSLNIPKTR